MLMKYEAIVVFDSNLDDEALKQQVERIDAIVRNHGGEAESKDFWGRRALAYPIKKKQYGNFVMLTLSGDNTLVADLRRQLKINDTVLRSFIVKKDKYAPDLVQRVRDDNASFEMGFQDGRRDQMDDLTDDGVL